METKKRLLCLRSAAVAMLVFGTVVVAQQTPPEQTTVPFSDPSSPGTIRINILDGSITIHGENRKDVSISGSGRAARPARPRPEADGLRRLTPNTGFEVTEDHNEITIRTGPGRPVDFDVRVPVRVDLRLRTVNGGGIVVEGTDGEIEASNLNGPINLTKVSGSVVANTVNGRVLVSLDRVAAGKAMAFTSLNGAVDVTLPASTKANLRLRSDMGDVYTDFDVQLSAPAPPKADGARRGGGPLRLSINNAITGTINGGGPEFELRTFNGSVYLRKAR